MRGDIWNNGVYMVGGEPRVVESMTRYFDLETFGMNEVDASRNYEAQNIAQCAYNNDTFITIGGFEDEEYFNYFQILGGMNFQFCVLSHLVCIRFAFGVLKKKIV